VTESEFEVDVTSDDARRFAELSGDWNPLHTDSAYASETSYRRTILHGAFSAGLFSRMAGMKIPGRDCLLYGIKLKFVAPILPPVRLRVRGSLVRDRSDGGVVEVTISDAASGARYVDGSYEFGRHRQQSSPPTVAKCEVVGIAAPVLVTGASGGLGAAVLSRLGGRGLGLSRSGAADALTISDLSQLPDLLGGRKIAGIVHCGWPNPDNQRLTTLGRDTETAISHHVAEPLGDCLKLAQALSVHGRLGATLVLVGSTAAKPGRHNWRMPLYSLSKSMIPTLVKVLAVELGARNQRCLGVVFDVIDGGMNGTMRDAVRLAHEDRSPHGLLASMDDAAGQVAWVLDNTSHLVSGALISLSGGAIP
jgi:acyl dehydratase/NAD(P)-dependent dehydrogenase (short-subunit alcohol dehydrogenase family)